MNTSNNIYNILKTLASLEPQPPKQESMLKQLNEGVTPPNPLSLKDRLAQKLAEAKEVDEDMLTPKEKKFANLAPPKDKVTYADKIAGAKKGDKKDVDEGADKQTMSRAAKGNEKYGKDEMGGKKKKPATSNAYTQTSGYPSFKKKPAAVKEDTVDEGEYQDGPNKSEIPASQRKAKAAPGDDSWKTSQQDLDDEASKSPTGAAGLAKAKARLGMSEEEQYDENNAHSSLPGTRRVTDEEHSEYNAAAHTVRKWMRKRGWDPKSEFKPAMKYIIDNLDSTHDDTLTDDVKMAACTCHKHHENIEEAGLDMNLLKGAQGGMKGVNTDPESERNSGKKYGYRNDRDDTGNDDDYDEHGNEKKGAKKSAPSDAPKTKGRPKKNFGPERTTAKAYKHKGARVAESINLETYVDDTMAEINAMFILEKDMGKHNNKTTGFKALAKKAGGGEKGEKIAGAQFQKMKKAGQLEESKQTLIETSLQAIVRKFGKEVREFAEGGEFDQDLFEALYDYYFDDMPYGVKKARDGDPYEWVADHFNNAIENGDVEISETKVHDSLTELAKLAGLPSAMDEVATDEGNEFSGARADAIRAGKNSFEVGGTSYNVTDDADEHEHMNEGGCNMTAEGQYCEVHGMNECGMMYEGKDVDQNNDSKNDWEDIKIARMKASAKANGNDDNEEEDDDKEKVDECGMPPMGGMMGGEEAESGMSINTSMDTKTGRKTVTVTADGEAAEELASMLRMAGMGGGQQPEHHELKIAIPTDASEVEEEYANQPDERTAPVSAVTAGGNDLNKKKTMYKHNYRGGDNPMSIKEHGVEARLARMLDRIKSKG